MFARVWLLAVAALGVALWTPTAEASSDRLGGLGTYERQAVEQVLARHQREIDPTPNGKRIRRVVAVNLDIFLENEGILTWLNAVHRTTQPDIVEREALFRPGDVYDEALVRETERNLRDPSVSSLVVVVPVKSAQRGDVDLLIVTRDVLSLRLNSDFELQNGTLTRLRLVPTENNLLGWRKRLGLVIDMDLGATAVGPVYEDPNIAGTRLRLEASGAVIFGRDSGAAEGSASELTFEYPLWSLARRWGGLLRATHRDEKAREFEGTELMTYDAPETPRDDRVPWVYDQLVVDVETGITRQLGQNVKHRVTAGHRFHLRSSAVPRSLALDPIVQAAFERDVLSRDERDSAVFVRWHAFEPRYRVYRNVDTFEFPEEHRAGAELLAELAAGPELLGSRRAFTSARAALSYHLPIDATGWLEASVAGQARLEADDLIDKRLSSALELAGPPLARLVRAVARASLIVRSEDPSNDLLQVGGQSGLRGYQVGAFSGNHAFIANLELRSMPIDVDFTRLGLLVFWDAGHAAERVGELRPRHDVGLGLRLLIPQLGTSVLRVDWAVPLQGAAAGLPGRITLGANQVF